MGLDSHQPYWEVDGEKVTLLGSVLRDSPGELTDNGACLAAFVVSLILCTVMYKLSRYISPLFFKSYKTLSREDQRNWDTRYSSMIHSALTVYYAYVAIIQDDLYTKDDPTPILLRNARYTYVAFGMSLGYFLIDWVCCYKYNMGGSEMLLHHTGSSACIFLTCYTGQCHKATLWMLATEFTTPFINFRWWLDKAGMRSSPAYLWNGIGIVVSWMFFRLALFPPFFVWLWSVRGELKHVALFNQLFLIGFPIILTLLNVMWFEKIVRGGIKLLFPAKKKED